MPARVNKYVEHYVWCPECGYSSLGFLLRASKGDAERHLREHIATPQHEAAAKAVSE